MQYLRNLFMLGLVISPVYLMANPVLEEVVVSARKVDESFQDVPIGMTVFTSSDVEDAGIETGDRVWRLPIGKDYDDMINSDIADMKNVGSGRGAGSITAAQFLKRFIGDTKWAHLDIAGVAWKGKGDPLAVKGATGFGLRLLDRLVRHHYED